MRGFRCMPVSAIHSEVLAAMTSFERDCYYSGLGAQDDRHGLPFADCALRSAIFPNRPFVGLSQIAAARGKLVARGVWIHKISPRKEWLEIHPDFRHAEGHNETTYGDESEAPKQGEFGFAPRVVPRRAQKINGSRAESEQSRAPESARPREPDPVQLHAEQESETREPRLGKDSGRFARDASAVEGDELWGTLCRTVGMVEMHRNGAMWMQRYKLCRDALATALSDWSALRSENKQQANPAAYVTAAFENEKRKFTAA